MALLLVCVGLVATIVVGGLEVLLLWVTGHDLRVVAVTLTQQSVPDGLPERPAPPGWVGPVPIGIIAVLTGLAVVVGSARLGHGTVGDGVTGIEARLADGSTPVVAVDAKLGRAWRSEPSGRSCASGVARVEA